MRGTPICAILLLTAGCAVGPTFHPPATRTPAQFESVNSANYTTNEPMAQWWREFNDPELTRLIDVARTNNPDLRIATQNLREARALLMGDRADFLPAPNAVASYSDTQYSQAALYDFPSPKRQFELYNAGFDATWELDIFGRVRREVQAGNAVVKAQAATYRDVQVSVVAEVARNYFELRGAQHELEVLRRNATNQQETLNITIDRLNAGSGTELDVARARAQWNSTLAGIPPTQSTVTHAMHRLAVLTGEKPEALSEELQSPAPLPPIPQIVSIGDPASLLRRRPDIRAAEENLAAATARIGVAVADLFPRVTFNGQIGLQASTLAGLGKPGSDAWSFGPSITWAALDYGHVRSRILAANAEAAAYLAQYDKTVLAGLEETENALADFGRDQARSQYLAASVKASETAATLARDRYDNGATDFLTVLDAERVLLEAQDQLAQTQTETATALVAVYKSLDAGIDFNACHSNSDAAR